MRTLIIGSKGQVASELARVIWPNHFEVAQLGRSGCDLAAPDSIRSAFDTYRPELVINAGAYTAVDRAESETEEARAINCEGPFVLADCCSKTGASLVHISTDYVFDGAKSTPYTEIDPTNPLSIYGRTKLDGEVAVRDRLARHIIVRTSWVFSAYGANFVKTILRLAAERPVLRVVNDQWGGPTGARDIAAAVKAIAVAIDNGLDTWGTFHFAGTEPTTWFEFAGNIVSHISDAHHVEVQPITSAEYPTAARRPANSVLDCSRIRSVFGIEQPRWQTSLAATIDELSASRSDA